MFSNILLQLIVLFLPTQLGLHFWPSFSRAAGIRIDYLSPTLYFTDILILAYIIFNTPKFVQWLKKNYKVPSALLLLVVINTYFSISPANTFFWWLRLFEYSLLFLGLRLNNVRWSKIKTALLVSTIFVVLLEIAQFLQQSSLGGIFFWFGERGFSSSTSGIARTSFFGQEILRPESTFSHPNSLSGYLLVVLYLLYKNKSHLWQRMLVTLGILLTFSKAALLSIVLLVMFRNQSAFLPTVFLFLSVIQLLLPVFPTSFQFVSDRLFYLSPSREMVATNPIFGVGLGSFIPGLAEMVQGSFLLSSKLQPVHNLLVLIVSEIGLFGVCLLACLAKVFGKKTTFPKLAGLITIVVITGTFDHYWLTLPQNKLILLLAAAVLL